jgi:hypothetical protein
LGGVPTRLAALLVLLALAAASLAGCGGSSPSHGRPQRATRTAPNAATPSAPPGATAKSCEAHAVDVEGLRATGISCDQARQVLYGWQREGSCTKPSGASRTSCLTHSYRCLGARGGRGIAVSCSRAGQSIAFVASRG